MRLTPIVLLVLVAAPISASAQVVFPAENAFIALRCNEGQGRARMTDPLADQPGFLNETDVVGEPNLPAGYRASDATNLYLRVRLEEDPAPGMALRAFSWGMLFDTNGNNNNYEILVLVDGSGGGAASIKVMQNTTTATANSPTDPAETVAIMFTFAMNGRSVTAPGSTIGGNPDSFLDFAVPWSALMPIGLDRTTSTRVWVASSNATNALNGDFACHDGASGPPTLTGTSSDLTTGDPTMDPFPGGGDGGIGTGHLEGGGGCAVGGDASAFLLLAGVGLVRRRKARRA